MNVTNISDLTRLRVCATAQAAAQTPVTGAVVDTDGCESVRVLAVLDDVAATCVLTLKLQAGDLADGTDMADIPGVVTPAFTADATSADQKVISLDVVKPTKRYVRPVLTRTTANAAVACLLAEVYDCRRTPVPGGDAVVSVVRVVKRVANTGALAVA